MLVDDYISGPREPVPNRNHGLRNGDGFSNFRGLARQRCNEGRYLNVRKAPFDNILKNGRCRFLVQAMTIDLAAQPTHGNEIARVVKRYPVARFHSQSLPSRFGQADFVNCNKRVVDLIEPCNSLAATDP